MSICIQNCNRDPINITLLVRNRICHNLIFQTIYFTIACKVFVQTYKIGKQNDQTGYTLPDIFLHMFEYV